MMTVIKMMVKKTDAYEAYFEVCNHRNTARIANFHFGDQMNFQLLY